MVEYEQEYFNGKGYNEYADFPAHKERVNHLIEMLEPKSVLDVGCAYGYIVMYLIQRGIRAVGMDISKYAESRAKGIIPHNYVCHDMRVTPYPFKDKEFDVLYCEGVLEHIEEEYIDKVMAEFERVSNRRYIQVSFDWHANVKDELGHVTIKPTTWWFKKIPMGSYLAMGNTATEENIGWLYKG